MTSNNQELVERALKHKFVPIETEITEKDVALYALGIGAGKENLQFVYEGADDFSAIPSMGVIFPFKVLLSLVTEGIEGLEYDPMKLLHGEQYLEIRGTIPTRGKLITTSKISNLYDKGKGILLIVDSITRDAQTGQDIVFNQFSLFLRGARGGTKSPSEKPVEIPKRNPDAVHTQPTTKDQALLYRLAGGDLNPLHADPSMSAIGGFDQPILHGLCSFGYAARGVLEHFCNNDPKRFKSLRVRFSKHVFPGETIQTQMWKVADNKVVLQSRVLEREGYTLTNAIAEIIPQGAAKL
ncbi:hypothetical protein SAMD00019534_037510 [Acytostelium subglobosum LB1]|uniref:hypothetical protein n=1 Tax=Acytostelium subglobosum LB1 TaxID=1410327 RepID=UPI00064508F1|nr:hypothetical protein SAMD00019534_037510 [Acytostelium subglobosum LB1]GAM20576.1 hypothetical protein SAMD00019534_037510 [Acytostelium subglobosum LB1]|eukprot:XP_012760097.1 hypothetical protein SAMD00019534_037510 [Acytostelium subglobosum LB1]